MILAFEEARKQESLLPLSAIHTVAVDDIRIEAFIGVHGHEKERRQSLIVAAELEIAPPCADALGETVDYNQIVDACRGLANEGIALIETFAARLAETLMAADRRIIRAEVQVAKPGALANGRARARACLRR
jgi:dihydroneopterin aldolase